MVLALLDGAVPALKEGMPTTPACKQSSRKVEWIVYCTIPSGRLEQHDG